MRSDVISLATHIGTNYNLTTAYEIFYASWDRTPLILQL